MARYTLCKKNDSIVEPILIDENKMHLWDLDQLTSEYLSDLDLKYNLGVPSDCQVVVAYRHNEMTKEIPVAYKEDKLLLEMAALNRSDISDNYKFSRFVDLILSLCDEGALRGWSYEGTVSKKFFLECNLNKKAAEYLDNYLTERYDYDFIYDKLLEHFGSYRQFRDIYFALKKLLERMKTGEVDYRFSDSIMARIRELGLDFDYTRDRNAMTESMPPEPVTEVEMEILPPLEEPVDLNKIMGQSTVDVTDYETSDEIEVPKIPKEILESGVSFDYTRDKNAMTESMPPEPATEVEMEILPPLEEPVDLNKIMGQPTADVADYETSDEIEAPKIPEEILESGITFEYWMGLAEYQKKVLLENVIAAKELEKARKEKEKLEDRLDRLPEVTQLPLPEGESDSGPKLVKRNGDLFTGIGEVEQLPLPIEETKPKTN